MAAHYAVTFDDVMAAHDAALENGGGISGIKDENLIRSAMGRPYQVFAGLDPYPTVIDKAGCLLHAFLNNHGFNDGSKRTAWIVCNGFLHVEDHVIIFPDDLEYHWYDHLALMVNERWTVAQVTQWLGQFVVSLVGVDDQNRLDP